MLNMHTVMNRMLVILLLFCTGFAARKARYLDEVSNQKLSRIIINVANSGLVLGSVMNQESAYTKAQALSTLGISFAVLFLLVLLGCLTAILLRVKGKDRGTYQFMTAFGNVGFMGMPVISSIFGPQAVFLAALFSIPTNLYMYTVGLFMISGDRKKVRFSTKALLNQPVFSSLAALVIFLLDIPFPEPVAEAASTLGGFVLPASMLVLGSSLGGISFREVFGGARLYGQIACKLLAAPVLTWAFLRLFVRDPVVLGVLTVIAAMPVASATTMLSIEYGGNEKLATRSVVLSTFLSVATIPLVVYLLLL